MKNYELVWIVPVQLSITRQCYGHGDALESQDEVRDLVQNEIDRHGIPIGRGISAYFVLPAELPEPSVDDLTD